MDFGFGNNKGIWDAFFSIRVLVQIWRDINTDVYSCFIDYKKALDSLKFEMLMSVLTKLGIDGRDIQIIKELHRNQTAAMRASKIVSHQKLSLVVSQWKSGGGDAKFIFVEVYK